jgi:hypothetical protein
VPNVRRKFYEVACGIIGGLAFAGTLILLYRNSEMPVGRFIVFYSQDIFGMWGLFLTSWFLVLMNESRERLTAYRECRKKARERQKKKAIPERPSFRMPEGEGAITVPDTIMPQQNEIEGFLFSKELDTNDD